MPFPVVGDLWVGAIRGDLKEKRRQAVEQAIVVGVLIPADARVVDWWAKLRSQLVSQLKGEGINDLWTAACCLVHDLPIGTGNLSDFQTIQRVAPMLKIVHPDL